MEKGQGFAIGAVLAAALFLRPSGLAPAAEPHTGEASTATAGSATSRPHKGPWIASCNYWANERQNGEEPDASLPPDVHATFDLRADRLDVHARLTESEQEEQA